jgi:hypothetical protein
VSECRCVDGCVGFVGFGKLESVQGLFVLKVYICVFLFKSSILDVPFKFVAFGVLLKSLLGFKFSSSTC